MLVRPEDVTCIDPTRGLKISADPGETRIEFPDRSLAYCVPAKARYVFRVRECATLRLPGRELKLDRGSRIVILTGFSATDLSLFCVPDVGGQQRRWVLELKPGEMAQVTGLGRIDIGHCTCGTATCPERHRLSSFDPTLLVPAAKGPQQITLSLFIMSAVKGMRDPHQLPAQGIYLPSSPTTESLAFDPRCCQGRDDKLPQVQREVRAWELPEVPAVFRPDAGQAHAASTHHGHRALGACVLRSGVALSLQENGLQESLRDAGSRPGSRSRRRLARRRGRSQAPIIQTASRRRGEETQREHGPAENVAGAPVRRHAVPHLRA
jgi:hypothetical protein